MKGAVGEASLNSACVLASCEILITAARLTASTMIRSLRRGSSWRTDDECGAVRLSACVIERCRGDGEEASDGRERKSRWSIPKGRREKDA